MLPTMPSATRLVGGSSCTSLHSQTSPVCEQVQKDPYLAGLATNFQMLLDHSEYSLAVSRMLASFDLETLEFVAIRVMQKKCIESYPIAQGGFIRFDLLSSSLCFHQ
jgi:hypothetical protein